MIKLVKCSINGCTNLTSDELSEYGFFCFQHTGGTRPPKKFVKEVKKKVSKQASPLRNRLILLSENTTTIDFKESIPKSINPVRRLPHPLEKCCGLSCNMMQCCTCGNSIDSQFKMKCGHLVCRECLLSVSSPYCPGCNTVLEGPLVSNEILGDIITKYNAT